MAARRGAKRHLPGNVPIVEKLYKKSQLSYDKEGGFCSDDDDDEPPRRRPAAPADSNGGDDVPSASGSYGSSYEIPEDGLPICDDCHKTFPFSDLLDTFDLSVCDQCRKPDTVHKLIIRTEAKSEFLLKDCDLDSRRPRLKFISKKNPHNPRWGDMKLYLRLQVEKRAIEVWGSVNCLEAAKRDKEEKKEKTQEKRLEKRIKELRKEVRGTAVRKAPTSKLVPCKHNYGDEAYDSVADVYSTTCTRCHYKLTYDKM